MPELPEVETVARGVDARVRGDRILDAWFASHREPFKNPAARQARGLAGRVIVAVHRTGKHIVCELSTPDAAAARAQSSPAAAQWIVHLGMTGRLLVTTPEAPVAAHTHARLSLASGRELRFVDPRRFGRLEFRDLARNAGFTGPGAEPLTIDEEEFARLFRGRRLAIKAALLNQKLLPEWETSMPMKACTAPASAREEPPAASPGRISPGCAPPSAGCWNTPSGWEALRYRTMSTPTAPRGSSNSSIASISAPESPAAAAKPPSGGS